MHWEKSITILIASWNQSELLERCLHAVRRFHPEMPIVLVDNGSQPPLQSEKGTCIRLPQNVGYAQANNIAFTYVQTPYTLLLNNDTMLPSAQPLKTLHAFLEAHPMVAAAQAKMVLPDGTLDACGELLNWNGLLYHQNYRQPDNPSVCEPYPVFAGKGACLLLRTAAIHDAGGLFRPNTFCYYEDIDLCHRLWLAGHQVWFVPTEPILHEEKASSRHLPTRQVWRSYLSNMLTSAVDLWGKQLWLTRGLPFLICIFLASLRYGILPRILRHPLPRKVRCDEKEILPYITRTALKKHLQND